MTTNERSVLSYMLNAFNRWERHDELLENVEFRKGLDEMPLNSNCGEDCRRVIDKAYDLLLIVDDNQKCTTPIMEGTIAAVSILVFG